MKNNTIISATFKRNFVILAFLLALICTTLGSTYVNAAETTGTVEEGDGYIKINGKKYTEAEFEKKVNTGELQELGDLSDNEADYIRDILYIKNFGNVILTYTNEIYIIKYRIKKGSYYYNMV